MSSTNGFQTHWSHLFGRCLNRLKALLLSLNMQIEVFISDNFSLFSAAKSLNKGIMAKHAFKNTSSIGCFSRKLVIFSCFT